ncbi:hypothetical protein LSUB1_G002972 [Lachnellula subtilissima]|uniref:Rhodopsin domain-containing protein n=1 Tax=Lachnellula subtilissima TaxID=602034 RepID=A0A8H8RZ32_9HELO|nr:hypothetical protein LSUB1_G002972 [Lachnellula subtilissima]
MGGLEGSSVIATEWSLLGIAYAFVATRMAVRLFNQQKALLVSDVFLLLSSAFALGLVVTDTMTYKLGGLSNKDIEDTSTLIRMGKIAFAGNYFYDTAIYFPKFSILALYSRLIPQTMPRLRLALWIVIGFVVISCLTTCLADTFWCGSHVASNWSLEEGACNAFGSVPLFHLDWSLNFISDVFIFALPFPLFRNLTLARRQLYGLIFTFALGLITIAVNVARFATIILTKNYNAIYVWGMAEMTTSIMVVCLPALRPLLRRAGELSSTDPKSSGNVITRTINSALSRTGLSQIGSSRVDNRNGTRRGNNVDRMERLSDVDDDGGSQVELTTQTKAPVIYKSQDVSVQSSRIDASNSHDKDVERQMGLGNNSTAWHE